MKTLVWHSATVAALTIALLLASITGASGYTQIMNNFDSGGNTTCGFDSTHPCIFWDEPANTSITVYQRLDSTLNQGSYDFTTPVENAFVDFNNVAAYNPFFNYCFTTSCGSGVFASGSLGCLVYGSTSWNKGSSTYSAKLAGYYAFFTSTAVTFNNNSVASWNNTLTWSSNAMTCAFQADGRKVATHETGHTQSLGHTSHTAVMHQGPENFYTLQSDDIAGLQVIYPGTLPY